MSLSNRQIKALKEGLVYKITHERKGTLIGQFVGYDDEPSRLDDPQDKLFLTFKYDVRQGTAQAGLNVTGKQVVRVSNLRPSLITEIEQTQEQKWLLDVKVPEEEKEKEPGLLDRLLGRVS